jgi:ATP-dependent DNA helicase RecG
MRPSILNPLFADVTALKGVGPRVAALIEKAAGPQVVDLVFARPQGIIDRSRRPKVADAEIGAIATLEVTVDSHHPSPVVNRPYRVICSDETGYLTLVFFNARADYLTRALPVGARRIVSGRIDEFGGARQMAHPDHIVDTANNAALPLFEPIYPLTAGLSAAVMRKAVLAALARAPALPEWQEPEWLRRNKSPSSPLAGRPLADHASARSPRL